MIAEALRYLIEQGQKSKPDIVKVDAEPSHIYYARHPDGTLVKTEAELSPACRVAGDLESLVKVVVDDLEQLEKPAINEIWVSQQQVRGRFGDQLRDSVYLDLVASEQYKVLSNFKAGAGVPQNTLILSLRTIFRDSPGVPELVATLRRVKFANGQVVTSEVGHGKASVGKEIMGEVTGASAIPEYATFTIPVFSNPSLRHLRTTVECALEPDPVNGNFRVIAIAGELENALHWATSEVRDLVADLVGKSNVGVYMGRP